MKLFIDDIRACPDGWEKRTTITDAIKLLYAGVVSEISLDHDICHESGTGPGNFCSCPEDYSCLANVLVMMPKAQRPGKVFIHSANPGGRVRIARILDEGGISFEEKVITHPGGQYVGEDVSEKP